MAKQHFLVSPFGELNLHIHTDHVRIVASDQLAGDWGLGWWHAHHSGDEAVFSRTFWRGELGTEPRPSLGRTELDAFIDHWAFDADLPLETSGLPAGLRSRVQAYSQGFNQGRRRKRKEALWSPEDCHLLARTLGFLEWWETRAPQIRFLLEAWQGGLNWDRILDLWPGLGPEPDKTNWKGLQLPAPFSPEARGFVNRIRRFRPGSAWVIPASATLEGRPLLGGGFVTDVTDPGLPFLPVRIDTPVGSVRGLSRPGHPGFLAGRTGWMAWFVAPVVDDTVDLRILDQNRTLAGVWAGTGRTGTLGSLLSLEECANVDQARERTSGVGSASLDMSAVDSAGSAAQWAHGPRWLRPNPRDAWLPSSWDSEVAVTARSFSEACRTPAPAKASLESLERLLSQTKSPLPEEALATLRFLLPDTEEGRRLRRWTGFPEKGPEALTFERLYAAVLEAFWESSPKIPGWDSPVAQSLAPLLDRLVQAPHSAWFPSHEKNHRLAEAVRRAFVPGRQPGPAFLGRRAPKSCWTEALGGKPRIFASTVAVVADPGTAEWRVFLTDDETEVPSFQIW